MTSRILTAMACAMMAFCLTGPARAQDEGGGGAAPRTPIAELPFHPVDGFFKYPAHYAIGRLSGVAVGPKGNIEVLNRGSHPVMEFKPDGSFIGSWGEGSQMFVGAHSLRFDRDGNLWYIDAADDMIFRFDAEGRTVGTLGNDPEPWTWLTHVIERAAIGKANFYQETDIGWDKAGNSYVSDGYGNSRVVAFDKDGNYLRQWGERGGGPGDFNTPHSLVIDNNDTIYVADRGNSRIQTFDTSGKLKNVWRLPTAPWSLCLTGGPNQVMFVGSVGKVYKMSLDGKILGQFGRPGRMPGTIDSIHQIACPDEKAVYLANLYASRIDKWVTN